MGPGELAGFERDPDPEPRTDFREFIFRKGREFEAEVLRMFALQTWIFVIDGFLTPTRAHVPRASSILEITA